MKRNRNFIFLSLSTGLALLAVRLLPLVLASSITAIPYITNFSTLPSPDGPHGPHAIAASGSKLYITNYADGYIYGFDGQGGISNEGNRLGGSMAQRITGIAGVTLARDGRLYATQLDAGQLIEVDPSSGAVLRTVATGLPCATHLAQDVSGTSNDLFISSSCAGLIYRVSAPDSSPTVSVYSTVVDGPDGLAVASDGRLFVAGRDGIYQVEGSASAHAGDLITKTALVDEPNGLALVYGSSGLEPFVYFSSSAGAFSRLDLNQSPPQAMDLVEAGERGEGVAFDGDGIAYVVQGSQILKVTLGNGSGLGGPVPSPTPTPSVGLTPTVTPYVTPASGVGLGQMVAYGNASDTVVGDLLAANHQLVLTKDCESPHRIYIGTVDGSPRSVLATLPSYGGACEPVSLARGSSMGGFDESMVFASLGNQVYAVAQDGAVRLFLEMASVSTGSLHLFFDWTGSFGYDLLVTVQQPPQLWRVNARGRARLVANLASAPGKATVAPASWGSTLAGRALIPLANGSTVAVSPQGDVITVSGLPAAAELQVMTAPVCGWDLSGATLFTSDAESRSYTVKAYGQDFLSRQADRLLVLGTDHHLGYADPSGSSLLYGAYDPPVQALHFSLAQCTSLSPAAGAWLQSPRFDAIDSQAISVRIGVSYPDATGYQVELRDLAGSFSTLASGSGPVDGDVAAVEPGSMANGVYQLRLTVDRPGGNETRTSYFSKGFWRYLGKTETAPHAVTSGDLAQDAATGHVWVGRDDKLLEFGSHDELVRAHSLPSGLSVASVLAGGGKLYLGDSDGQVHRFALPAYGQALGTEEAATATGLGTLQQMALFDGKLYVQVQGVGVKVFNASTMAAAGLPLINTGMTGGDSRGLAVDTTRRQLWVSEANVMRIYNLDTGALLRSTAANGTLVIRLALDSARGLVYSTDYSSGYLSAFDLATGHLLGRLGGGSASDLEGGLYGIWGLLLKSDHSLLTTEYSDSRLQNFEPLFQAPTVGITAPLPYSVVTGSSLAVAGQVKAPGAGYSWALYQGTTGSMDSVATGSGDLAPGSSLGSVNTASLAEGTYKLRLEASKSGQATLADEVFFSKGPWRFLGALETAPVSVAHSELGQDSITGHLWVGLEGKLLEYGTQGELIRVHALPSGFSVVSLVVGGGKLYLGDSSGQIHRFALPGSYGQALGSEEAATASGLGGLEQMALFEGKLYVNIQNLGVKVFDASTMTAATLPLINDGMGGGNTWAVAIDASRRELWASENAALRVYDVDTGALSRTVASGGNIVVRMAMDSARGLVYATDYNVNYLSAYDLGTGLLVSRVANTANSLEGHFAGNWGVLLKTDQTILTSEYSNTRLQNFEPLMLGIGVTPTLTPTISPTFSQTTTATVSPTQSPSATATATQTTTATASPSATETPSATPTESSTETATSTQTPSSTESSTETWTWSPTPTITVTPTFSYTSTFSVTSSASPSPTPSVTPTLAPGCTGGCNAIYCNDFDSDTTGAAPSGWDVSYTSSGSATVVDEDDGMTGKALKLIASSYSDLVDLRATDPGVQNLGTTHFHAKTLWNEKLGTVIFLRMQDTGGGYWQDGFCKDCYLFEVHDGGGYNPGYNLFKFLNGVPVVLAPTSYSYPTLTNGQAVDVDAWAEGNHLSLYLNGTKIADATDGASSFSSGAVGIASRDAGRWDEVKINPVECDWTATSTGTATPSATVSATATPTSSATGTSTASGTATASPTFSCTGTVTETGSETQTSTASPSLTASVTLTATPTVTPTFSSTPTATVTATASQTLFVSPTPTVTSTLAPGCTGGCNAIYCNDFDADTTGAAPSGWEASYTSSGSATVVDENDGMVSKALKLTASSSSDWVDLRATDPGVQNLATTHFHAKTVWNEKLGTVIFLRLQSAGGYYQDGFCRNGYFFEIHYYQGYNLFKMVNGSVVGLSLTNYTYPTLTYGQVVDVDAWAEGTHLSLYINGSKITEATDSSFSSGGVAIASRDAGRWDEVKINPVACDWTATSTVTPTPSITQTWTASPSATATATITPSPTGSPTHTATTTITFSPSASVTATESPTATQTTTPDDGDSGSSSLLPGAKAATPVWHMPDGVSLLVAPNPARGPAQVYFSVEQASIASLQIINISGEVVRRQELGSYSPGQYREWLNLQGLAGGVYFVALDLSDSPVSHHRRLFKLAWVP